MILTLLLVIPFLGALLLSLWPEGSTPAQLRRLDPGHSFGSMPCQFCGAVLV